MKPGDAIWTRQTVHHAAHHKPDDVWFGDANSRNLVYCKAGNYIRDSPALPAIAACLAENPDARSAVEYGMYLMEQKIAKADATYETEAMHCRDVLRSLVKALSPEAGDGART